MGESFKIIDDAKQEEEEDHSWVGVMMEEEENDELLPSSSSSIGDSSSSTSSFDTTDDASSSVSSSSAADHSTPSSYDLSELMAQLPIKRGLSKFYQGKSESFTSLARVTSIEDLVKKESPYRRKMKACKSYGGGLDTYRTHTLPKPIISKKSSTRRVSSFSSFLISTKPSFAKPPPPLFPVQESL